MSEHITFDQYRLGAVAARAARIARDVCRLDPDADYRVTRLAAMRELWEAGGGERFISTAEWWVEREKGNQL